MARKPKTAAIDAALAKRGQRASALFDATLRNAPDLVRGAGPGALDALGRAYGVGKKYVQSRTPQQVAGDVAKGLGAVGDVTARYATDRAQNPLKLLGDAYGVGEDFLTAVPQAVGDVAQMSERAQALKATDPAAARRMQAGIAMAAMGVMPGVRTGKKVAKAVDEAEKLAAKYAAPAGFKDIRTPRRDYVQQVVDASFDRGRIVGNQTAPLKTLTGGVTTGVDEQRRVNDLVREIGSDDGYFERLIVDQDGNVVEGQHRLEALRKLGVENVPIVRIRDVLAGFPVQDVKQAINTSAGTHPDNVNQILEMLADAYAEEKGSVAKLRSNWTVPRGFETQWNAALSSLEKASAPAQNLGAKYGLPEFTTDLTPAQIEANRGAHMAGAKSPPVLYHGTPNWEGTAYNPNQPTLNRVNSNVAGFYADTDPESASGYALDAKTVADMVFRAERGEKLDPSELGYGPSSQVLPVHVAIKNPFVPGNSRVTKPMLDAYAAELKATNPHLGDSLDNWVASKVKNFANQKSVSINALDGDGMAYQRVLKAGGYDGLNDGTAWIAFEPTQIKSTMNRGTFDPNDPHISKAHGGLIAKYGVEGYAKGGAKKPTDIELAVQKLTRMKPGVERPQGLLPLPFPQKDGKDPWTMPQFAYDLAKAFVTPGVAAQGGSYDTGDVVNMAMNVTGGGLGASHVAGPTVRPGQHVLGMGAKPKTPSRYVKPSVEPVVTQAGRMGLPLGGKEQMAVAHPSAFGPYATIKPRVQEHELKLKYEDTAPMGQRTVFSPEKLENATVIPLYGDRSIAGKRLVEIDGIPVDVSLFGGPRYAEMNAALNSKAGWASELSSLNALRNQIRAALEEGRDVYGAFVPMSPRAADQTTMMTDLLLQEIAARNPNKSSTKEFDTLFRKHLPDFEGVADMKGAREQLSAAPQYVRKAFTETADQAPFLKAGFPDVSAARLALTERELRDMPAGALGYSMVKFGPESLKPLSPTLIHPTYSAQMAGTPMGGFEHSVPFDMIFRDMIERRRAAGQSAGKDLRALELSKPSQRIMPEQIDLISRYLEAVRAH